MAVAWMVFQAASLAALVPRDCCEAHAHTATVEAVCHESATATHCPMPTSDGKPCPMHGGSGTHDHGPAEGTQPVSDCSMRGSCDGSTLGFIALVSQAVLTESPSSFVDGDGRAALPTVREQLASRFEPPDPPPPRA